MLPTSVVNQIGTDLTSTINQIFPVAVGVFVVMFGISLVPRLFKRFGK